MGQSELHLGEFRARIVFLPGDRSFAEWLSGRMARYRITKSFASYYRAHYHREAPRNLTRLSLLEFASEGSQAALSDFESINAPLIVLLTTHSLENSPYCAFIRGLTTAPAYKDRFLLFSTVTDDQLSRELPLHQAIRDRIYVTLLGKREAEVRIAIQQLISYILRLKSTHELSERDEVHRAKLLYLALTAATMATLTLSVFWTITAIQMHRANKALNASEQMASFFRHSYLDTLTRNGMDATADDLKRQMDHSWNAEDRWSLADWQTFRKATISLLKAEEDEELHHFRAARDGYFMVLSDLLPLYAREPENFDVLESLAHSAYDIAEIDTGMGNFEEATKYNHEALQYLLFMQNGATGAQARYIRSELGDLYLRNAVLVDSDPGNEAKAAASAQALLANDFDEGGSTYTQSQYIKSVALEGAACIAPKKTGLGGCRPSFEVRMRHVLAKCPLASTESPQVLTDVGRMLYGDAFLHQTTEEKSMAPAERTAWTQSSAYFKKAGKMAAKSDAIEFDGYLANTCATGSARACKLAIKIWHATAGILEKEDITGEAPDPEAQKRLVQLRGYARELQNLTEKLPGGTP